MEQKLRKYIESALEFENVKVETKKNWAFGAVDFAFQSGLIDSNKFSEIAQEYGLYE